ncbi:MAG: uroporphyrinogen decarboxylase family protein [Oscillospiraceae bacterium]|jgi:uroporphyrinogen decarboxylase|nr:uroporphyrinogen decarboxylase family protein [Oscillospiraceae bacterium]
MNMRSWAEQMIYTERKKALPVLSFPCVQYLYITVRELVADANHQAIGMRSIIDHYDMAAALGYMDLSVEAEAFGANIVYSSDKIPTVTGRLLSSEESVDALKIPKVGEGRTQTNLDSIRKSRILIHDRPVFAQCIGPFSLAGRLLNVNEIMPLCYEDPDMVLKLLRKVTDFLREYAAAFKTAGANGIIIAEPLAGLLSPELVTRFSTEFVREIIDSVQDNHFLVIYHNCGNSVPFLLNSIIDCGAAGFHFGDSADMVEMLDKVPSDRLVLGNISPAKVFNGSSVKSVEIETMKLLQKCGGYKNFIPSSGCDLPPDVDLENVTAFFRVIEGFYYRKWLRDAIA